MGIKWEDVRIFRSPITNELYLGKGKESKIGFYITTDKSKPVTEEIKVAIMSYMDEICKRENLETIGFECQAGTLSWTRNIE